MPGPHSTPPRTVEWVDDAVPRYESFFTVDEHRDRDRQIAAAHDHVGYQDIGESADGDPLWAVTVGEGERSALETFEECDAPQDALETLELLVEECQAAGDEAAARDWHRQARELLASVPDSLASQHREWVERYDEEGETD